MAALISFPTLGKWLLSLTSCYCTIVSEKSHPTCKEISAARPVPWSSESPLHSHAMTSEKKRLSLCLGFSLTWPALLTGCSTALSSDIRCSAGSRSLLTLSRSHAASLQSPAQPPLLQGSLPWSGSQLWMPLLWAHIANCAWCLGGS